MRAILSFGALERAAARQLWWQMKGLRPALLLLFVALSSALRAGHGTARPLGARRAATSMTLSSGMDAFYTEASESGRAR